MMRTRPLLPSSEMSTTARSGSDAAMRCMASLASPASQQTMRSFCWLMTCARPCRIIGWSSTNSTLFFGFRAGDDFCAVLDSLPFFAVTASLPGSRNKIERRNNACDCCDRLSNSTGRWRSSSYSFALSFVFRSRGFLRRRRAQRTDDGSSPCRLPLHDQRTADGTSAILHDAQPHSIVFAEFLGESDAVVLHSQHDSISLREKVDHDQLCPPVTNGILHPAGQQRRVDELHRLWIAGEPVGRIERRSGADVERRDADAGQRRARQSECRDLCPRRARGSQRKRWAPARRLRSRNSSAPGSALAPYGRYCSPR